jgi:hypothetical protein
VHVGLLLAFDPRRHLLLVLLVCALGFVALGWAVRRLAVRPPAAREALLVAAVLRLLLLPLPPTLSDDLGRYLWDGRVATSGNNPYALPPSAPELEPLRDDLWRRLPHREVPTIYPPLALAAFSIASRLPGAALLLKAAFVAADLLACALLLRLAAARGTPPSRVLWYAWNPLVAFEVAAMGHVEPVGIAACLAATLALVRRPPRPGLAGAAAAAAALAKLAPAAALPMWARQSRRPALFVALALGLLACGLGPIVAASGGVPPGLVAYGVRWEFDGPLFEPLWRLLAWARADVAGKRALDALEARLGDWQALDAVYPWVYPQLLAKLGLAAAGLVAIGLSLRERDPIAGTGRLFGRLLLVSATVHPWYVLWILPWAALCAQPAWIALSGLVLLSYLAAEGAAPLWPWIYLAVWLPFFALLLWRPRWSSA